jgi:hypothetical protein
MWSRLERPSTTAWVASDGAPALGMALGTTVVVGPPPPSGESAHETKAWWLNGGG